MVNEKESHVIIGGNCVAVKGSAEKRQRQNEVRRIRNKRAKSQVRTAIRKFKETVETKDKELAAQDLGKVIKLIDTSAGKGLYHRNTAARKKSRLSAMLNGME
ncbi:MAG: 30S ribosomal protein S20 [Spirochaetales bacterium]|nr:30S ribosomal protein S20 [Spirochaetales bacterium]